MDLLPTGASTGSLEASRKVYTLTYRDEREMYKTVRRWERKLVSTVAEAQAVSSLTTSGTHAPSLDLDLGCALSQAPYGVDLWVDAPMSRRAYRRLLRNLADCGLGGAHKPGRSGLRRAERQAQYATARREVLDLTSRDETLRALGPELECDFDEALEIATANAGEPGTRTGPPMDSPWRIPLVCDAVLVPSTNNWHLYFQAEMAWATYERLMRTMVKAHLLEKSYFKVSRKQKQTYLRLPWVHKDV